MKRILFLASFLLLATFSQAQPGYKITLKVKGIKDSVMFLANYFAHQNFMIDTGKVDLKNQVVVFEGNEALPHGIYIFAFQNTRLIELAIGDQQHFVIETDTTYDPSKMKLKGSQEVQYFLDYLVYVNKLGRESDSIRKDIKSGNLTDEQTAASKARIKDLDSLVVHYKKDFRKKHPDLFLADVFGLMEEIEVPEPPLLSNGRPDSAFKFYYYRDHYFDHFDWTEAGLLRTPIFHNKIKNYLNNLTPTHPDSIIVAAEKIVNLAKANNDLFKFCVQHITNTYENHNILGMDKVFVHMAKNYYCTGKAFWIDAEVKRKICERAYQLEAILLFAKAPELVLKDTANIPRSLHAVKGKYTLMYFWDPECGHCQKTTPVVKELYDKYKSRGLDVYAIYTEKNVVEWKKSIRDKQLNWWNVADIEGYSNYKWTYDIFAKPVIYLLDENKKIVLKRVEVDKIAEYLEEHLGKDEPEKDKEKGKETDKGKGKKPAPKAKGTKVL